MFRFAQHDKRGNDKGECHFDLLKEHTIRCRCFFKTARCFASLNMTNAGNDKSLPCHSERSEESSGLLPRHSFIHFDRH